MMGKLVGERSNLVKWAITIGLTLIIFTVPVTESFTMDMHIFLAIVIFCISTVAFEFFDVMIPALLMSFAFLAFDLAPIELVFSGWTKTLPYQVIGAFILANVLNEIGLLKRVAFWVILRTSGTYRGLVFGIWFAAVIASLITSGNAFVVIAAFCYGICKALELKPSRETTVIFAAGIMGTVTSWMFIYFPAQMPFLISAGQTIDSKFNITWLEFFVDNLPYFLICIVTLWIITMVFKPTQLIQGKESITRLYKELPEISSAEIKAAIVAVGILLFLTTAQWHGLDVAWALMIGPLLLYMPGVNVGSKESIKNINFSLIIFIISCMSIGAVGTHIGLSQMVSDLVVPILENSSGNSIVVFYGLLGMLLNVLLTPMAILGALCQPFAQIAADLNINIKGAMYGLYWGTDQVFLPHEINAILIFFSFGFMPMKYFIKVFSLKTVLFFVGLLVCLIPWWHFVGAL
ncbi:SLC13 family permease [Peptococcus simiae]|uniref:SLC13 family permease n=1 Tax=Peptococcus simiae TaxID=1643805 RepID=A0ABW9H110_9FIRM